MDDKARELNELEKAAIEKPFRDIIVDMAIVACNFSREMQAWKNKAHEYSAEYNQTRDELTTHKYRVMLLEQELEELKGKQ